MKRKKQVMEKGGAISSGSFPGIQISSMNELLVIPDVNLRKCWVDQLE